MQKLTENGLSSYLVYMPFNLALFDIQAADDIIQQESSIKNWYLAGHSLGGAMVSSYAEKNAGQLEGVILLARYSVNDLIGTNLSTLFIYRMADEVMD